MISFYLNYNIFRKKNHKAHLNNLNSDEKKEEHKLSILINYALLSFWFFLMTMRTNDYYLQSVNSITVAIIKQTSSFRSPLRTPYMKFDTCIVTLYTLSKQNSFKRSLRRMLSTKYSSFLP